MNDFGLLAIGIAARVTVLGLIGAGTAWAWGRRGPEARASVVLSTLLGLVAVSALAFSPWPHWWSVPRPESPVARVEPEETSAPVFSDPSEPTAPEQARPVAKPAARPSNFNWSAEWLNALATLPRAESDTAWRWPAWVGLSILILVGFGFARMFLGILALTWLRRLSLPLNDQALLDEVELLRAEMSCGPKVELRESAGGFSPATFGWLRPVILLPSTWRDWDSTEREAVLAHELGHVKRGDFLAGLIAQLSLSLHFWHPLAHGLVGRLRLEQELAADAWGARVLGGNRAYLTALAKLALRDDGRQLGRLTRAFLPTRDTLMRRIEMLKDQKATRRHEFGRPLKFAGILLLGAATLITAGLRGPLSPSVEASPMPVPAQAGDPAEAFGSLPVDAQFVIALRPAELLARPDIKKLVDSMGSGGKLPNLYQTEMPTAEVASALIVWKQLNDNPLLYINATGPQDWSKRFPPGDIEAKDEEVAGKTIVKQGPRSDDANQWGHVVINDRSAIVGTVRYLKEVLLAGPVDKGTPHVWDNALKEIKPGQLTILGSGVFVKSAATAQPATSNAFAALEPLWTKAYCHAISVTLDRGLAIESASISSADASAEEIAQTIGGATVLGRNLLNSYTRGKPQEIKPLVATLDELLKSAKVNRTGRLVHMSAQAPLESNHITAILMPALQANRNAALRTTSMNNLKMIALAMHNYADANGSFPPAVLLGPDGKTAYSWRVALLPYLGEQALYDEYRKDELWDSPANRKVLEKMPAVYAASEEALKAKNASYFAIKGPGTLHPEAGKGTKLAEIFDGTSNTIMAVEAKREIPWTKPEDITYDASGSNINKAATALPKFGGVFPEGFNTVFADGAVRFISNRINPATLHALISSKGGEVVNQAGF